MTERPFAHVIGDPIAQSKSPVIHGFWLEKLGIEADYSTERVSAGNLGAYVDRVSKDPRWRGTNVTMPLKLEALERADVAHSIARRIGVSNTLVPAASGDGGKIGAFNTDAAGFLEPLQAHLKNKHYFRMARILGTGGAARAIVTALYDEGFTLVLAGRNPAKARAMLDELAPKGEHHAIALDHFAQPTDFAFDDREGCFDLIVNASPLGMTGQPPLSFDWSHAPPGAIVYDIVTSPLETEFLKSAR
ncbi:MAG: shikimate dehydrogenase, partial [Erythrobacter sp.]|nr:shikimate dehydrogenase [Erythrobacter sp.]